MFQDYGVLYTEEFDYDNYAPFGEFVLRIIKLLAVGAVLIGLLFGGAVAYDKFNTFRDDQAKLRSDIELLQEAKGALLDKTDTLQNSLYDTAYLIFDTRVELDKTKAQLRVATLTPPPIKNLPTPSMASRYAAMKSPTVEIMISGTDDKGQHYEGHGSGVIVSPNFILTVYHVASEAKDGPAEILFENGSKGKATMIWSDPKRDVAIMVLEQATGIKPAVLSDSKVTIGQDTWSVGYPLDLPLSVQHGEVVSDELSSGFPVDGDASVKSSIFTNMTMGPGDSGGPVFNSDGEVVGLNDFILKGIGSFSGIVAMQAIIKDVKAVLGE